MDHLAAVDYYQSYIDGKFGWRALVAFHNEHRIALPRIAALIDGEVFDFNNRFLVSLIYIVLFVTTVFIATLALRSRSIANVCVGTVGLLGLTWSVAQFEIFSVPFTLPFPLVHLFALTCFYAVACCAMADTTRERIAWFCLSIIADVLGVLSLASGVLIGFAAIAIPIWLRRYNSLIIAFVLVHVALVIWYFIGYRSSLGAAISDVRVLGYIHFFIRCLGSLSANQVVSYILGSVLFLAASLFLGVATWRAIKLGKPTSLASAVLLAFVLFVMLEVAIVTYGRGPLAQWDQPLGPRYANYAVMLSASLLALCFRAARSMTLFKLVVPIGAAILIFVANDRFFIQLWYYHVSRQDSAAYSFINGVYAPDQVGMLFPKDFPTPGIPERIYRRLAELRKGPFASSASVYRPPLNSVLALDISKLANCRGQIEQIEDKIGEWTRLSGWLAAPTEPAGVTWIFAYSSDGSVMGYTRPTLSRKEMATALSLPDERIGFDLFLNGQKIGITRPVKLSLVALLDEMAPAACIMSATLLAR